MAGDAEVIVLDDSSDEDVGPAAAGAAAEAPDVEEVPVQAMEIDDRDLDSDEEIAIVGQTGFVSTIDFPHARADCGANKWGRVDNKDHCANCFCFVCDVKASECKEWGDGSCADDHCNAIASVAKWKLLRQAKKSSAQQAASGASAPANQHTYHAAAYSSLYGGGGLPASAAPILPLPPGGVKSIPKEPVVLPDPSADARLLELGTLEIPVKAMNKDVWPISRVKATLRPHGVVEDEPDSRRSSVKPDAQVISLRQALQSRYVGYGLRYNLRGLDEDDDAGGAGRAEKNASDRGDGDSSEDDDAADENAEYACRYAYDVLKPAPMPPPSMAAAPQGAAAAAAAGLHVRLAIFDSEGSHLPKLTLLEVRGAPTRQNLCAAVDELFASAASAAPSSSAAPPLALPPLAASDRVAVARFSRTGASSPWNAPVFYRGAAAAEGSSTREVPGRLRVDHEVNQPQAKLQEARETFDPMAEEALYVAYRVAGAEGKPLGLAHVRELGETTQRVTGRQRKYSGSSQVVHSAESPAGALPLLFALDDEMHMFGGGPAHTSVWAKLTAALRPFRADDAAGADTAGAGASASEDRLLPHAARLHHSKPRSTRVSWSTYPDLASATSYGRSFYRHSDEEHPELLFAQAVDEANGLVVRKLLTHPKAGGELFVKTVACDWPAGELDARLPRLGDFDVDPRFADRLRDHRTYLLDATWERKFARTAASSATEHFVQATTISWESHNRGYCPVTRSYPNLCYVRSTPDARCSVSLEEVPSRADPSRPSSRRALLRARVYVRDPAAPPPPAPPPGQDAPFDPLWCGLVFDDLAPDDGVLGWRPEHARAGHSGARKDGAVAGLVEHLLAVGNPQYRDNVRKKRAVTAAFGRDGANCTIARVLEFIEAQERSEAAQPPGLAVQLRPYQRQSLAFMLEAERQGTRRFFWSRLELPGGRGAAWYHEMTKTLTLTEPRELRGGFLCEEMGLGKTVMCLALILAEKPSAAEQAAIAAGQPVAESSFWRPEPPAAHAASFKKATQGPRLRTGATLVVCAVSLVGQWIDEAKSKLGADAALSIYMYHGAGRIRDAARLSKFGLVVTTYQTMGSDFASGNSPLHGVEWFRVILDESHTIKTLMTVQTQACLALRSARRWCCTGTPAGTDIADLQGQLAFLELFPFTVPSFFDKYVKRVFGQGGGNVWGNDPVVLLYTLSRGMMRHTKSQCLGGQAVLALPPKTEELVAVEFTAAERAQYAALHKQAKAEFDKIKALGSAHVSKCTLQVMSLLLPLRRMCSGGTLRKEDVTVPDLEEEARKRSLARRAALGGGGGSDDDSDGGGGGGGAGGVKPDPAGAPWYASGSASGSGAAAAAAAGQQPADAKPVVSAVAGAEQLCGLCGELVESALRTGCNHWFCRECLIGALPESGATRCPTCERFMDASVLNAERDGKKAAAAAASAAAAAASAAAAAPAAAAAAGKGKGKRKGKGRPRGKGAAAGRKAKKAKRGKGAASSEEEEEEDSAGSEWGGSDEEEGSDGGGAAAAPRARSARISRGAGRGAAAAAAAAASDGAPTPADEEDEEEDRAAAGGAAAAGAAASSGAAAEEGVIESESKLRALVKELQAMRKADPTNKALIFSQFNSTLDWLKLALARHGFGYRTIDGSMALKKRARNIESFQKDPPTTVFLLSVRSGAVGINLTAASHIFLLEPMLNPALEAQAIGRAWRMGQTRAVTVKKLYVKGTVEERIMDVMKTRSKAPQVGAAAAELAATSNGKKVKASELAGAIKADKQDLRLNELEVLFS